MFTGIIEGVGIIREIKQKEDGLEVEIQTDLDFGPTNVGDFLAVNGCCLNIASKLGKSVWVYIPDEFIDNTTFADIEVNQPVNLERPLQLGSRLGGHIVQGHIDGIGEIVEVRGKHKAVQITIEAPSELEKYIVVNGSVAIDGVSLPVDKVEKRGFQVTVVLHTKINTTLSQPKVGSHVNLEVDIVGKYVEKLTFLDSEEFRKSSKITKEFLKKYGF